MVTSKGENIIKPPRPLFKFIVIIPDGKKTGNGHYFASHVVKCKRITTAAAVVAAHPRQPHGYSIYLRREVYVFNRPAPCGFLAKQKKKPSRPIRILPRPE